MKTKRLLRIIFRTSLAFGITLGIPLYIAFQSPENRWLHCLLLIGGIFSLSVLQASFEAICDVFED